MNPINLFRFLYLSVVVWSSCTVIQDSLVIYPPIFSLNGSKYLGVNAPQTVLASVAVFTQMIFTGIWGYLSCSSQVPVIGYSTAYIDGTTYEQTSLTWPFTPTASPEFLDMRFAFDDITLSLATPLHTIGISWTLEGNNQDYPISGYVTTFGAVDYCSNFGTSFEREKKSLLKTPTTLWPAASVPSNSPVNSTPSPNITPAPATTAIAASTTIQSSRAMASSDSSSSASDTGGTHVGPIVGGVIGGLAVIVILGLSILYCCKYNKNKGRPGEDVEGPYDYQSKIDSESGTHNPPSEMSSGRLGMSSGRSGMYSGRLGMSN